MMPAYGEPAVSNSQLLTLLFLRNVLASSSIRSQKSKYLRWPPIFLSALLALTSGPSASSQGQSAHDVDTEMRNVMYHFTGDIAVYIQQLKGKLIPKKDITVFDDKQSFILEIDSATIAMSADALSHVLNDHVFTGKDAPLKDLVIHAQGNEIKIQGKLAHKGNVSFEMVGSLEATPEGKIRLHAKHLKAAHLPMKGLLDLFGVKLAGLIDTKKVNGVFAEKDDIILDPEQILPPPQIQGKVTSIRMENGQIIQVFGTGTVASHSVGPKNFMAYKGAVLRFGKLTMSDTDLVLIDADPRDPFDFYLDNYREQLTAGYTKTTSQFGLRVYMVDYDKLPGKSATRLRPKDNLAANPQPTRTGQHK